MGSKILAKGEGKEDRQHRDNQQQDPTWTRPNTRKMRGTRPSTLLSQGHRHKKKKKKKTLVAKIRTLKRDWGTRVSVKLCQWNTD